MKKLKLITLACLLAVLVLELLPYGAVLRFADPENGAITQTYSYFDLTPFGYANFGPFLTALLTALTFVLWAISLLFRAPQGYKSLLFFLSLCATFTSLTPLIFGTAYFTLVGVAISVLLGIVTLLSLLFRQAIEDAQDDSSAKK